MTEALLEPAYKRRFLLILFFVCLFNFADRAVFSVVAPAMRFELHLTDFQLGILQGFSFALLYGGLGIPVGRLAERYSRVRIIAWATGIWSLATMCCGFAGTFLQMMAARVTVGMGEAGFTAPASSLVADLFEPRRRASAMSIVMLGLPLGTLVGAIGGGLVAQAHGWRTAFLVMGVPGLLVALLAWLLLREPPRGLVEGLAPSKKPVPPLSAVITHLLSVRTLRHVLIGGAVSGIGIQGVSQFMALLFTRLFHLPIGAAGALFGLISGVSLSIGLLLGAMGTDRISHRDDRWTAWGPAAALAVTPLFYLIGFNQSSVPAAAVLLMGGGVMAMVSYGPTLGLIANLTPVSMRASSAAVYGMCSALVGVGLGPTTVGFASDRLAALAFTAGDYASLCGPGRPAAAEQIAAACGQAALHGLREAMMVAVLSFAWAAVHFYLASRSLPADLARARSVNALRAVPPG